MNKNVTNVDPKHDDNDIADDNVNMSLVPRYGHQATDLVITTPYSNFGQINKNQHKRVRTVRPVLVNPKG